MSSTEERNAKDDLALCDKATPGPWHTITEIEELYPYPSTYLIADTNPCRIDRKVVIQPDKRPAEELSLFDGNADFIATAREALPYWIERAVAAEKKIAELIADLYEANLALQEEGKMAESMDMEAEIAVAKAEEWEQALERAANYIADTTGACPLEFDLEVDFETCTEDCKTNSADCWKQYFAKGAGA